MYQGSKISHWSILKDLPYRRKVMNKMFMEATIARGKADNKLYLRTMQGDSASESDEDWEEYYDSENDQRFWVEREKKIEKPIMIQRPTKMVKQNGKEH